MNDALAHVTQKSSADPASNVAKSAALQLTKQFIWPVDSDDAQTSFSPAAHSPGTAQQSASDEHVCVQYPLGTCVKQAIDPLSAAASIAG